MEVDSHLYAPAGTHFTAGEMGFEAGLGSYGMSRYPSRQIANTAFKKCRACDLNEFVLYKLCSPTLSFVKISFDILGLSTGVFYDEYLPSNLRSRSSMHTRKLQTSTRVCPPRPVSPIRRVAEKWVNTREFLLDRKPWELY